MTTDVTDLQADRATSRRPVALGSSVAFAVLRATSAGEHGGNAAPTPFARETLVARLARQLLELGVRSVVVLARPAWTDDVARAVGGGVEVMETDSPTADLRAIERLAATADGSLLVSCGDIAVHREALAGLISDPSVSTGMPAGGKRRPMPFRVQSVRGALTTPASPLPAAFALRRVLTFRHYLSYRVRQLGSAPAGWVGGVPGRWDGRLIAALVILLLGLVPAGHYLAAAALALGFTADAVAARRRTGPLDEGEAA